MSETDLEAAKKCGALFYSPPDDMAEDVDPLIRPICESINKSEWVWTAESCAGHPEADEAGAWFHNTSPFLRLVTHETKVGRMMELIFKAIIQVDHAMEKKIHETHELHILEVRQLDVIPSSRPSEGWTETIVRITAVNVYQRNQALMVWKQFAENVNE